MEIKMVKEGILIPKGMLRQLGMENFEILTEKHEILIRPKTSTKRHYGFVGSKKIDEKFILSLENEWHERGED
jgi:hypothetical protein